MKRWLAVSGAAVVIATGVVAGGSCWRLESNLKTVDLSSLADLAGELTALKPDAITYVTLPTETYPPDPNRDPAEATRGGRALAGGLS